MTDDQLLHYVAGLFDGEGYAYIAKSSVDAKHSSRYFRFQGYTGLTIKQKEICDLLCNRFGGKVTLLKSKNKKHSDVYKWLVNGKNMDNFMASIVNILIVKKERVELLIEFQKVKKLVGNKRISDEHYNQSAVMHEQMHFLNKRGPK